MGHHTTNTVTQEGVTASQPGVSVSVQIPAYDWSQRRVIGAAKLSVTRHYNNLKNQFGGKGVSKKLDGDGMIFASSEEAWKYAKEHGYIRPYYGSYERKISRRARGDELYKQAIATKLWLRARMK